ncbi:hypothetical protein WJX74_006306 [Apatococcus lobatus]|uniref:Uncharacterized protein n=2 Tax=Apatococcus TaxID=904362 RepID=A0AAW1SND0_9CHLO
MEESSRKGIRGQEDIRSQYEQNAAEVRTSARSQGGYSSRVWASAVLALILFWCILSCITFTVVRRSLPLGDSVESERLAFASWRHSPTAQGPDFLGKEISLTNMTASSEELPFAEASLPRGNRRKLDPHPAKMHADHSWKFSAPRSELRQALTQQIKGPTSYAAHARRLKTWSSNLARRLLAPCS